MGTTGRGFRLFLPALVLGLILTAGVVHAQRYADTFLVTVAEKTPEHPYYGVGSNRGYVVNGVQGATLTLVRDSLYLFRLQDMPRDLTFLFYSKPIGGTKDIYSEHVEEQINSQGLWIVKATDETPDTLYYASVDEPWVGGTILIVDSLTSSVEESEGHYNLGTLAEAAVYPNPFAEEAELRFVLEERSSVRVDVVNALGQVVGSQDLGRLEAGERIVRLDGSALSPGLYLYRVRAVFAGGESVVTGTVQVIQ